MYINDYKDDCRVTMTPFIKNLEVLLLSKENNIKSMEFYLDFINEYFINCHWKYVKLLEEVELKSKTDNKVTELSSIRDNTMNAILDNVRTLASSKKNDLKLMKKSLISIVEFVKKYISIEDIYNQQFKLVPIKSSELQRIQNKVYTSDQKFILNNFF